MSVEGHMAWLVAFNDGLFNALSLEEVPALLGRLGTLVQAEGLTLEQERTLWSRQLVKLVSQSRQAAP